MIPEAGAAFRATLICTGLRSISFASSAIFGGMVALEMAKILRPRAVFLIASGYSGNEASLIIQPFQRFFKFIPMPLYRFGRWALPPLVRLAFGAYGREASDLIIDVMRNHVDFVTWRRGIASIAGWRFQGGLEMPVYALHGTNDWLMPLYRVPRPEVIVEGGPHLINISHPEQTNAFLTSHLN